MVYLFDPILTEEKKRIDLTIMLSQLYPCDT